MGTIYVAASISVQQALATGGVQAGRHHVEFTPEQFAAIPVEHQHLLWKYAYVDRPLDSVPMRRT